MNDCMPCTLDLLVKHRRDWVRAPLETAVHAQSNEAQAFGSATALVVF